jgi:hypothetical protein
MHNYVTMAKNNERKFILKSISIIDFLYPQ